MATRVAIVVAAGRGTRMGAPDKVLLPLAGRPALAWSLRAAAAAASVDAIVVVHGEHTGARIAALVRQMATTKPVRLVAGGDRRQDSVANGLAAAAVDLWATVVAVHDGARPLATPAMFDAVLDAAERHGAAIVATPIVDTLKRVADGMVVETVPRDGLWAAQTPQAFSVGRLADALDEGDRRGLTVTDEAALFEALGWPVAIAPGDPANLKLTHPGDIPVLEALLWAREGRG
jgi:2-C-methyl-D-erythritol 4-phosphate cytidylyltransferase